MDIFEQIARQKSEVSVCERALQSASTTHTAVFQFASVILLEKIGVTQAIQREAKREDFSLQVLARLHQTYDHLTLEYQRRSEPLHPLLEKISERVENLRKAEERLERLERRVRAAS